MSGKWYKNHDFVPFVLLIKYKSMHQNNDIFNHVCNGTQRHRKIHSIYTFPVDKFYSEFSQIRHFAQRLKGRGTPSLGTLCRNIPLFSKIF